VDTAAKKAFEIVRNRPKILFVTSHWPLAPAYGAQQRVLNVGKLLSCIGDVSFVIVSTDPDDEGTACRTKREFEVCRVIRPPLAAPRKTFGRLADRLRHEFDATYMATDPHEASEPDCKALVRLIQQHDLVWIHTIRTANWFRIYRWIHSVLDVDDLPSRTLQSAAQARAGFLGRLIDLRRAWIWRRRERVFPERFDILTVCSEDDRQYLGTPERTYVIPNGSHPWVTRPRTLSDRPRVGFIGNCTFAPNEEGLKWFIRDVWPAIKRECASAQLRLVGRGSDSYLKDLGPDIARLGWLEDPGDEIASWSAMIVPIKVGGGTRVKVADGFARGCPVVATTIGAFGYDVKDGEEILLADRSEHFASACVRLLRNPALGAAIAEKAHQRFLERWTWDSVKGTVEEVVQECLARKPAAM
jgi:glycosyltransferase involved in cell wall biosynthesis